MRASKRIVGLAAAMGLLATGMVVAPVASAKTNPEQITACVNKKTGAMRLLTKGKCKKKKERTISWWVGQPNFTLTDANGMVVPDVTYVNGGYFARFTDGYFFDYSVFTGKFEFTTFKTFKTGDCTGPTYWSYANPGTYGAPATYVVSTDQGATKSIFTSPNATTLVPAGSTVSELFNGVCTQYQTFRDEWFAELVPLAVTPSEYVGPIKVTRQ